MRSRRLTHKNTCHPRSKNTATLKRRLSTLTLVVVVSLGLLVAAASTSFAYLALETNQSSNPFETPVVQVLIIENDAEVTDTTSEVALGADTKKLEFANPPHAADIVLRATLSPQIISDASAEERTVYEFFNSGELTAPVDNTVITGDITLHFAAGWDNPLDGWFFQDGFFYYNSVLEAGTVTPPLLVGVTTDRVDIQLEVFVSVEALQAYPNQAKNVWGVSIS